MKEMTSHLSPRYIKREGVQNRQNFRDRDRNRSPSKDRGNYR